MTEGEVLHGPQPRPTIRLTMGDRILEVKDADCAMAVFPVEERSRIAVSVVGTRDDVSRMLAAVLDYCVKRHGLALVAEALTTALAGGVSILPEHPLHHWSYWTETTVPRDKPEPDEAP